MGRKFEKDGARIETNDDGSANVRTAGGASMSVSKDRNVSLDLETIESVGIRNLSEVASHTVNEVMGSVSHLVRFRGGGELRFAYNSKGELIELSAKDCSFHISNRNELLFQAVRKKTG